MKTPNESGINPRRPYADDRLPSPAARRTMLITLALAAAALWWGHRPPAGKPLDASPAEFSAERALEHIRVIADGPHRTGTEANREVRDYLVRTLEDWGLEPVVQRRLVARGRHVAMPENVIVRLPGTDNTRAFMFCAHYDSVPYGPGAADDCGGVGTMLEACRALRVGRPLRNDVIFLFSDGEERGLNGARAFAEDPDWMNQVGAMLNLEARGVRGPAYMFETSAGNGWLIEQLAEAVPNAITTSLAYALYSKMGLSSDFGVLKHHTAGYNIAIIDQLGYYHTVNDNPQNVSPASLQHMGDYTLGLARHFGELDLTQRPPADDAVYFWLPFAGLVHYPLSWSGWLTGAGLAGLLALIVWALVRGHTTLAGLLAGLGTWCAATLVGVVLGTLMQLLAFSVHRIYYLYDSQSHVVAAMLAGLAVLMGLYGVLLRRVRAMSLALGGLLALAGVMTLLQWTIPEATYLTHWPLLLGLVGAALLPYADRDARWPALAALGVPALLAIWLLVPQLRAMQIAIQAVFVPGMVALMAPATIPLLPAVLPSLRSHVRWVSVGLAISALVVFVGALVRGAPSPERPRFNSIVYALDADAGEAFWLSHEGTPDKWTRQFFGDDAAARPLDRWLLNRRHNDPEGGFTHAPAPVFPCPTPIVEVRTDRVIDGRRQLKLWLRSARGAPRLRLRYDGPTTATAASVRGHELDVGGGRGFTFDFAILPPEGLPLELRVAPADTVRLRVMDTTYALPEETWSTYNRRPVHMAPKPNTVTADHGLESDTTLVVRTLDLGRPSTPTTPVQ